MVQTVIVALVSNALVAVAKSIAAVVTGSASMLAEAAHSWADCGNEIFLLVAERRSSKQRDSAHPLGYGRESYVWSLFAAFGLFTAGAVVSVQHGITELITPEPATDFGVAYAVLAIAAVLEGVSFAQSIVRARQNASRIGRDTLDYALNGSNSTLRAVLAEDAAALTGLAIAFTGILLHQITGNPVFDAIGSLAIGILLGAVALVLINRNRRYLVGSEPRPEVRARFGAELTAMADIERVTYLHLEFVGPGRVYLIAAVDLVGDGTENDVARKLRDIERSLQEIDLIEVAILTVSVDDEPTLSFAD
jgi:cation diffusion facilitator family transporter